MGFALPVVEAFLSLHPVPFFLSRMRAWEKTALFDEKCPMSSMSRSKFAAPFLLLFAVAWLFGQIGLKLFFY